MNETYPQFNCETPREYLMRTGSMPSDYSGGDLGSVWDAVGAIGAAATQVTLPLLLGSGGGSSGPARGSAAVAAYCRQAIDTLNQILTSMQAGQLSRADAVSNATRIVSSLSDSNYVYQAQHGDDANILRTAKSQAGELLRQIQALAGSGQTSPAGPIPNETSAGNVSTVASAPTPIVAGIDNSTLLLVGGGLALLLLLK